MVTFYPVSFTHEGCGEVSRIQLFLSSSGEMIGIGTCSGCGADINFSFTVTKLIRAACPETDSREAEVDLATVQPLNKFIC